MGCIMLFCSKIKSMSSTVMLQVGYIVMKDPSTGARTNLLRMRDAGIVGVYHPLIDEQLGKILHGYQLPSQRTLPSLWVSKFSLYIIYLLINR